MRNKNPIITCFSCSVGGNKKNLAEIMPDGLKVIRSISEDGEVDFSIIKADSFELICGSCKNVVFYRKPMQPITLSFPVLSSWGTILNYYGTNN